MRGRRWWACGVLLLLLARGAWGEVTPQPAEGRLEAVATQPWLALLTSFIGGTNVNVTSLQDWNADGKLVRRRFKSKEAPSPDARFIALDSDDARAAGLKEDAPNLRCLYAPFPVKGADVDVFLSDPATLPFVAQRVLKVLSEWDPSSYPYYQRRLAEFQTRLSGSVLAGQQVLRNIPVFDLTGFSGSLLQAAGCKLTRPEPSQIAEWSRGRESALQGFLATQAAEGVLVVIDAGTPRAIRKFLEGRPGVFFFERPSPTQDYPAFLHDQYLALWQKITIQAKAAKGQ